MAEIPLRSYLHEIEKHIESGRTDQAISHSRYLLQVYPKCVDAYRLLGKSYLESQRYTDAGDIFQRVLSAVPDDFVSQVGMSIIREDEGNLDEAIWHMERAFEVQPSNNAIQEELRRLYAKRDNIEPPKIRLTRGALARLYYKGELYQQAVSEIRSALAENSNRHDLRALLADIYLKINQRVEAADTALEALRHLPNCMIAIQVMIHVLAGADREEELKNYRQRLAQLDPYTAFTNPETPNVENVQDNAVRIEKLDWKPDQIGADTATPAWAASLGVDLADLAPSAESTLPDWLDDLAAPTEAAEAPEETSSAFAFGEIAAESAAQAEAAKQKIEEDIPDWLREAGWQSSASEGMTRELHASDEGAEIPAGESIEEGIVERDSQLAEAEIPDWLQALKPAGQGGEAGSAAETGTPEEDMAPWLDKILPVEPEIVVETPDAIEFEPGEEAQTEPDWLKAVGLAGVEEAVSAESLPEAVSDAFAGAEFAKLLGEETPMDESLSEDVFAVEPAPEESFLAETDTAESAPAEPLPFWLEEPEVPAEEAPSLEAEMAPGFPDWLAEPAAEEAPPSEPEMEFTFESKAELSADLPDWLLEAQTEAPDLSTAEPEPAEAEAQNEPVELPDWDILSGFGEEKLEPLGFGTKNHFDAEAGVEIPSWLRAAQFTDAEETSEEAEPAANIPDWLIEQEPQPIEESPAFELDFQPEKFDSALPDWLSESSLEASEPEEITSESAELPGWLLDVESELPEEEFPAEAAVEAHPEAEIELPDWLIEAAAESQVSAEEEPSKGAAIELPDWLIETEAEIQIPEEGEFIQETVIATAETFEPILAEQPEAPESAAVPEPGKGEQLEEAFAWLMGLGVAAEPPLPAETLEAPAQEPVEAEEAPPTTPIGRVAAAEPLEPEEPALSEAPVEIAPDTAEPETVLAEEPTAGAFSSLAGEEIMDEDAAFAWLESLAVKQGASEALLLTPEERSESMPEWVKQDALAAEAALDEIELPAEEPSQTFEFAEHLEAVQETTPVTETFELEEEIPAVEALEEELPVEQAFELKEETPIAETFEFEEKTPAAAAFEEIETFEVSAEPAPEPEAPPTEQEIPELPDWMAETAAAPIEEIEWVPPKIPERRYDLNEASLSDLERLPGIGFITAQTILNYRSENGPFQSVDDLVEVPGVGSAALAEIRDYLYVTPSEPAAPLAAPAEEPAFAPVGVDQEVSSGLTAARLALSQGDLQPALEKYSALILSDQELEPIAADLRQAAVRFPEDSSLWQALGDAYLRLEQVQAALEAYVKAEQLLH